MAADSTYELRFTMSSNSRSYSSSPHDQDYCSNDLSLPPISQLLNDITTSHDSDIQRIPHDQQSPQASPSSSGPFRGSSSISSSRINPHAGAEVIPWASESISTHAIHGYELPRNSSDYNAYMNSSRAATHLSISRHPYWDATQLRSATGYNPDRLTSSTQSRHQSNQSSPGSLLPPHAYVVGQQTPLNPMTPSIASTSNHLTGTKSNNTQQLHWQEPIDETSSLRGKELSHICEYCGKAFLRPSALKTHIISHTGDQGKFTQHPVDQSTHLVTCSLMTVTEFFLTMTLLRRFCVSRRGMLQEIRSS
ncbi:hypothetical protein HHX47_DHR10000231 [Lentinula edodes]|nr:hypothetical protein HHX47_DHR10000231 [Lentinula edodes]